MPSHGMNDKKSRVFSRERMRLDYQVDQAPFLREMDERMYGCMGKIGLAYGICFT